MKVRLHAVEPVSRANGPGPRTVIWFQGCTLGCPACFNPTSHDVRGGFSADTITLAAEIRVRRASIEGISVSGGEPFQQPEALLDLLERLGGTGLSRLVFSGYTRREIHALPLGDTILRDIEVLIAGRYVAARHVGRDLLGSANQTIHLLTDRHAPTDFLTIPKKEIIIHEDGTVSMTGIDPLLLSKT